MKGIFITMYNDENKIIIICNNLRDNVESGHTKRIRNKYLVPTGLENINSKKLAFESSVGLDL